MIAEEIRAAIAAKSRALIGRSEADILALLHPDLLLVTAGGKILSRADYIDVAIRGDLVFREQQVRELEMRQFGTTAVANLLVDDCYLIDGREIRQTFQALWVFIRTDGRWLWVAGQAMTPRSP